MLQTKAVFHRKDTEIESSNCVIDKVIHLSGSVYDSFSRNLLRDWDFISNNRIDQIVDKEGRYHCLLVVGEGRRDGILVNAEGGNYARYSAFIPNAEDFLTVGRYSALAALNQKLTEIVDAIVEQTAADNSDEPCVVDLQSWDELYGIDQSPNTVMIDTVLSMLDERDEIKSFELDDCELIIYRETEPALDAQTSFVSEKPSVMDQIKKAQKSPLQPRKPDSDKSERQSGPEL